MWAYTAGITPELFWDATVREVLLIIKAFDQRELTELRRLRLLRYDTYCLNVKPSERVSIYEYMPIEDDPTPEEVAQIEQEEEEERQVELRKAMEETANYYRQHGVAI